MRSLLRWVPCTLRLRRTQCRELFYPTETNDWMGENNTHIEESETLKTDIDEVEVGRKTEA